MQVIYYWPDGFGGSQQMEYDTDAALAVAVSTGEGADALSEVASALGVSNAEAQRRCVRLAADMLAGRVGA